jgi:hypothetical protein
LRIENLELRINTQNLRNIVKEKASKLFEAFSHITTQVRYIQFSILNFQFSINS